MPVTTTHPQYDDKLTDWELMRDSIEGEGAIKGAGIGYLPKTSGQLALEHQAKTDESAMLSLDEAREIYQSYKRRAQYPLWVKDSLRTMMGLVSRQEPEINLPTSLASLQDEATADGFPLKTLFLRSVLGLLAYGRQPLLADWDGDGRPYVALYGALDAINWREADVDGRRDLVLSVLREAVHQGDEFSHDSEARYRVLDLNEGRYRVRLLDEHGEAVGEEDMPGTNQAPLDFIPLVFLGSTDNNADTDEIPLLTMAKAALKSYQLSADYYTSLHYTSHPQPWIAADLGEDEQFSVSGPMAAWNVGKDGKVGYLEFQGAGIEANRTAMQDQRNTALEAGARVIDAGADESGEARKARQSDQHTSLYSVVVTAAEGIEQLLRYFGRWLNLPQADIDAIAFKVEPKFSKDEVDAAMLQIVHNIVMSGSAPREVLFDSLRKAGLTDKSDEELESMTEAGAPAPTEGM
ncbi:DUF4055 domain-containing protein [Halomonas sp. EF61]|uniref:DUF4055 domain-containing protein n=1 Tax=Halomonas sp. EF61 TaxID=2950869 RepID=UPI0032DE8576